MRTDSNPSGSHRWLVDVQGLYTRRHPRIKTPVGGMEFRLVANNMTPGMIASLYPGTYHTCLRILIEGTTQLTATMAERTLRMLTTPTSKDSKVTL
jgi:hypothetical protein